MDAQKFGTFVAECRKEKNMTQADLAIKLDVTDKAISRWERGVGFPDINTIEPLADALEISVLELMKSEKIETNEVPKEDAAEIINNTLSVAKLQRKQERKNIFAIINFHNDRCDPSISLHMLIYCIIHLRYMEKENGQIK